MAKAHSPQSVVIVIHESATGPGHDLRDYFIRRKVPHLLFIAHPLLNDPANRKRASRVEVYIDGVNVLKNHAPRIVLPGLLAYLKDIPLTVWWVYRFARGASLYVGLDSLNATAGILLRAMRMVGRVVYFAIDYIPQRSSNPGVNAVYHDMESRAAASADATWNLSPRIIKARESKWRKKFSNQLIVPHGTYDERTALKQPSKNQLVYMGSLYENKGVQLVIEALPLIQKKIPDIRFVIIGKGPCADQLNAIAKRYDVQRHVDFKGYVDDPSAMRRIMAESALGVALYDDDPNSPAKLSDPGKIKQFLSVGVPVVTTDVPYIAKKLVSNKCGIIVPYEPIEIAAQVVSFLKNKKQINAYKENAVRYAMKYNWDTIFDRALVDKSTPF